MQSKDKKQYKRTCYGCHNAQGKAAFSDALKKQVHNNFPELYCNKCLKARRLSVRNEVIDFSVEDNYIVMKLAPSQYCEPYPTACSSSVIRTSTSNVSYSREYNNG